jgi:hypothetical protein
MEYIMARNSPPTKTPAKLTDRFIEDTLEQLSNLERRIETAEKKAEAALDELQIREYIATNRHGPGDHTFTVPPEDKATVVPFDKTKR